MSEISIKRVTRDELHLLLPLMKHCFNMEVDVVYIKWKFLENPAGEFVGFGAFKDGELLGFNGIYPELYCINGKEQVIFQLGDVMTHSSIRRMGMFEKLATACYNHIRESHQLVVIGFGGEISTHGLLKMGWKKIKNFNYYFKHHLHCRWSSLWINTKSDYIVNEVSNLDDIIQLHHKHTYRNEKIYQKFTAEYVQWKISNPRRKYHSFVCYQQNEAVGYIIFYKEDGKIVIFDFVYTNRKVSAQLLNKAYEYCKNLHYSGVIGIAAGDSLLAKRLLKVGFLHNPFSKGPLHVKVPFMLLADNPLVNDMLNPQNWLIEPSGHDAL